MSVLLFRVDERLIHGQVVVAWARRLKPRRIIVVDDDLAANPMEQSIYRTGLPEGLSADFWSEEEALAGLPDVAASAEPVFVLTADLRTMARLARQGIRIAEINVGCLQRTVGRHAVLPYVCLDATDEKLIEELEVEGVRVIARDVPTGAPVRLGDRSRK
jgi:PTS system mannose-specific IIB component/fructoselysine and glucoselysine-specific PTS system IIB component